MKKWIRRFVMTILGLVLGTGMYMICAERVLKDPFPMPFGIGFANVVSGSMEPALKKGTLLLVRKKADAEIGDIVVYQSGESIIVHRIISAEGDQVITKGDANETEDIPIKRSQIKGVVMFKIPEIGKGIQWLQTLARYSGADHKQESAKVAAFEHGEQILQPFSRAGKTGDLQPGTDRVYALTVTNEKNGNVSETRQNYSIQVTTAGTLPLTYVLKRNNTELGRFSEMVTENYLFQTADMWFEAGKKEGHAYELEVIWPEDKKDVLWADVPDLVKIQVHMEQAETTASTFVVPVLARYHHSSTRIWEIASVPFYFTSDRLTEEGKEYQLSPETEALSIELRNDQDGNRWSDTPIHYIYQVKKDGEEQEEKGGEGILYPQQGAGSSERIVIQDMTPGVYDIEVQSQSPFEKTLKGTFIIPEKENDIFCVKEDRQGSFCVQLTVSVKDYEGNIKIFWPEGLIPDSTQAVFEDVKTRTEDLYEAWELTLWMEPYTSRTFRFFKTDAETDYTWDTKLNAEAAD